MGPTDDIRGLDIARDRVPSQTPPTPRAVTQSVPTLSSDGRTLDLDSVKAQLAQGIRVKIDGFGTFKPRGRNVTFSADKTLKDLLKPAGPQRPDGPLGDRRTPPDGQSKAPPF